MNISNKIFNRLDYLESPNEKNSDFIKKENTKTNQYFKENKHSSYIKKRLDEILSFSILQVQSAKGKLFGIKVNNFEERQIIASKDNFKTNEIIFTDNDFGKSNDISIYNYYLSPTGKIIAVVTKNLWDIFYTTYIFNLENKKLIKKIYKCEQVVFYSDDLFFTTNKSDMNDMDSDNHIIEHKINEEDNIGEKVIFSIDEINDIEIILSPDKEFIFLNILLDYFENDVVYYKKINDDEFNLIENTKGRFLYCGSDKEKHYFQTNYEAKNFMIVSIDKNYLDFQDMSIVLAETNKKHKVERFRSAFMVDNVLIIYQENNKQTEILWFNKETNEKKILLMKEGVYSNNGYEIRIENNVFFYFTYESIMDPLIIYKVNIKNGDINKIYQKIEEDLSLQNKIKIKKIQLKKPIKMIYMDNYNLENRKILISFNNGYSKNLLFNAHNFHLKTPILPLIEKGYIYVEIQDISPSINEMEENMNSILEIMDYLKENNYTNLDKFYLYDGGMLSSTALIFTLLYKERVKALVSYNMRTDLIGYIKDEAAYMFKNIIREAGESKEIEELLLKYSPIHQVKRNEEYPACLFICLEGALLVPSYHSKKMVALLNEKTIGNYYLRTLEEDDDLIVYEEINSFLLSQ